MRILSYFGLPRLLGVGKNNAQGLPPQQAAEVNVFVSRPQHWATILNLINSTSATYDEVRATGSLGNMPLVVISANTAWFTKGAPADDARKILNDLQSEIAGLSTNSSHRIIDGATHGSLVHNQNDAQAVISAIEDVLTSLQTGSTINQIKQGHSLAPPPNKACTGRWGFCGIFEHFSGFEFSPAPKQSPRPPQRQ